MCAMSGSVSPSDVRFVGVSLDCSDPVELSEFYLQMLGGRLLWTGPTSVGVPFIRDGLSAGEPVMAAVTRQHAGWLQDALDGQAGQVTCQHQWGWGKRKAGPPNPFPSSARGGRL